MITLNSDGKIHILTSAELKNFYSGAYKQGQIDMKEIADDTQTRIRDSERNRIFSILRTLGVDFSPREVMKVHKEWEENETTRTTE